MNKLKFLIGFNLKRRILTKAFLISSIITFLCTAIITLLPTIISLTNNDNTISGSGDPVHLEVAVVNEVTDQSIIDEAYITNFYQQFALENNISVNITFLVPSSEEITNFFENSQFDNLIKFSGTSLNDLNVGFAGSGTFSGELYQRTRLIKFDALGISDNAIIEPIIIIIDSAEHDGNILSAVGVGLSMIPAIILFVFISMGTALLGTDIVEEKQSRAIENIISSITPRTHFLSKIVAVVIYLFCYFGVILLALFTGMIITALVGPADVSDVSIVAAIPNFGLFLLATIVCIGGGVVFFLTITALIAALSPSQEAFSTSYSPLILIAALGYMIPMIGGVPEIVITILAFVPGLNVFILPTAMALGLLSWWQSLISMLLIVVTVIVLLRIIQKPYQVSLLEYEEGSIFKKIKNSFKKSKNLK